MQEQGSLYDQCRAALENLVQWYKLNSSTRNEATTRLQLIDRLFFECLAWSKEDVVLEDPYGPEYADYVFTSPRRILIVEAKKEGDYFEIPSGSDRVEFSLQSLCRDNPNLKAAVQQVANYCQSRGVPYAAVSNGHQMVVFVAVRTDGIPPLNGKALVFRSLDYMLTQFFEFWQAVSRPGISDSNMLATLVGVIPPELPAKLSASIASYPGVKGRNPLQTDLQIVSELVMEDIARARDLEGRFLHECYCQSGALSQYSLTSKKILSARYAALFGGTTPSPTTVPATDKHGISTELLAEGMSRRPILLVGDAGVGKTMFIRHLIKIDASNMVENSITLYFNFGSKAALTMDIRLFIFEDLMQQLREEYGVDVEERNFVRGVYDLDLKRFAKGIYSDLAKSSPHIFLEKEIAHLDAKIRDRQGHLKSSLLHLSNARRQQVIIILDNADQRDEQTQQQAFLVAQELAENFPAIVFVALRPETYYRSRSFGAVSGYHAKAFTIAPPRIDQVLDRRLRFASRITSGEIPIKTPKSELGLRLDKLDAFIRVFIMSLQKNPEINEFLDNISGGNVRLALDLVKGFFGSGHVDTAKILEIYEKTQFYQIPLHEFLRAVLYGDAVHYAPEQSPLANLFDLSHLDRKEHFLMPLMIGSLSALGAGTTDGFVETYKLYQQLQGMGFTPEQIDAIAIKGCQKNLVEPAAHRIPRFGEDMPLTLRATTVGLYHVSKLASDFAYVDAVIVDTPVLDENVRFKIKNVYLVTDRLDRSEIFCEYLDHCWDEVKESAYGFDWRSSSAQLRKQINTIRRIV